MQWCTKIDQVWLQQLHGIGNYSSGSCQGMVTTLTFLYGNNILAHISVSTPTTILTTKCKHSETKFHVESCLTATGQYSNLRRLTQVWNCQFKAKRGMPVPKLSRSMDNGTDYSVKTLMDCTLCVFFTGPFPRTFLWNKYFLFSCFLSQFHLISCVESQKFLEVRYTACTCSKPRLPCP